VPQEINDTVRDIDRQRRGCEQQWHWPKVRDRLRRIIRQHKLDPELWTGFEIWGESQSAIDPRLQCTTAFVFSAFDLS
jgi:hypothetical protein